MQSLLDIVAALLGLSAVFGYLNHRFLKLPPTIGLVIMALVASLVLLAVEVLIPGLGVSIKVRSTLDQIDFHDTLMTGMLSFLLFAGAMHVNLADLKARRFAIGTMATGGLLLSTALIGGGSWLIFQATGLDVPFIYCLLFGSLISPTDPIAVLGILKTVSVPTTLKAKIAGESLFNDGVAVVVFVILLSMASGSGHATSAVDIAILFAQEAVGGVILGLITGGIAFLAMRSIDEYVLEVLISLALVTITYSVAISLHTSGPIAVVIAGLLIGNYGTRHAMSEITHDHLNKFWELIDEVLNAVLFLLIGLEVLALTFSLPTLLAAALAIPLTLAARLVSVALPISLLGLRRSFTKGAIPILTWGGLRGGISVALVLSLPDTPWKETLMTVCYVIVVFSIIVQGLTISPLIKRLLPDDPSS
ncbi:MAG: sodium:proton antiporter [Alphaproteobacteria bacterium]|jgi:monovalent cation:H+ antiporter, CPA1 family|nr:sodium:proton antiporter [Alphaproteobacteria bacterium]MBT4019406.1 sodium:proton antiporter [Alphaproteobacteria bacterium]MBT5160695.1 sodium:proton antiporter [Alphaproteobacteria bacterium]